MPDRARTLDPLGPAHDVTKSVFLVYERGDIQGANASLVGVLKRHRGYAPALARLSAVCMDMGQSANGIRYGEEALALDPQLEETRRVLIRAYGNLGDAQAARQLVGEGFDELSPRALPILLDQRRRVDAGEVAYASLARGTVSAVTMADHLVAIRMHARTTGDFERARTLLEEVSGVRWDATGQPVLREEGSPLRDVPIALADILLASGQEQEGRRLLATIIARMRQEMGTPGHPEIWYYIWHPVALALNGDGDAASEMLQARIASKFDLTAMRQLETEPSFAELRKDPRFQALMRQLHSYLDEQRRELDRLRAEGLVPDRSGNPGAPG
jgi:tetratricopeptide (TPR) repeat protein